jgi:small subunit ribosomal protein S16
MVKIRLTRTGRKHLASFRIVISPAREKRESKFIEYVGSYSPHTKELTLNKDRVQYWLSQGAQPTETVKAFLIKEKILEKSKKKAAFKDKPGKKSTERAAKKAEKTEMKKEEVKTEESSS